MQPSVRKNNLRVEEGILTTHLTGLVQWVSLRPTHCASSHLRPQVSLSSTQGSQSSKDHRSDNNTGDSTSSNNSSGLSLIIIQEASDATMHRGCGGGEIRYLLSVALLCGTVTNTNITIRVSDKASPGEVHTPNSVVANSNCAPVCRLRADKSREIATRSCVTASRDQARVGRN